MRRYFEDFEVGETWISEPITLSQDDIIRFASEYDAQPMHIDPEAAAASRFGSLIASGWQLAALTMKVFVEAGGYGETPMLGVGLDEMRWLKPARAGDRLTVKREVTALEPHQRRPDYGRVRTKVTMINQDGETVMSYSALVQVPARTTR